MAITIDGTNGLTTDNAALKLDGTTLVVDDTNNNVGIGTATPNFESGTGKGLHVNYSGGLGAHIKLTDSASGSGATDGFDIYAYNTNGYIENYESGNTIFRINGAEKARILASGGITFNGDTAAANALDDYEEGTWTPTSSSVGYTISSATGTYTKIGRVVHIYLSVIFSAVPASNSQVLIAGNPFSVTDSGRGVVREGTNTGAIYMFATSGSSAFEINSMDGVSAGSQRTIRTSETYTGSLFFFV